MECRWNGVDYDWCKHYGWKDQTEKQSLMHIHAPHYHTKWAKRKDGRISKRKEKRTNEEAKVTQTPSIQPLPQAHPK